jgi:Ca-activated chloride channel homolog
MDAACGRGSARAGRHAARVGGLALLVVVLFGRAAPAAAQPLAVARDPEPLMLARTDTGQEVALPLIEESARVEIDEQHATTVVTHVYENRTGQRVEGHFVFRTGEGANVDGFSYWNGSQKIVGEVMERGAARQIYQSTVDRRRDPGLLEKTGEGTFSFKVFPIEPGEKKRIEITVDQWLARRDRAIEYRLPIARPTAEVEMTLRDGRHVRRVVSTTHSVEAQGIGTGQARVRVGPPRAGMDRTRELAVRYELEDAAWKLHAHMHRDPGQLGYMLVSLAAPPFAGELSQDLTIVLDASATMAGDAVRQARVAAGRIVQRLRAADRLNVMVMTDEPRSLYATPRWATKQVRDEAIAFLLGAQEGRGGDLARGLQAALAAQDTAPRPRTVLMLTDGRSGARRALALAEVDTSDTRVFTVGFGAQVDRPALSRLASLKRGRFMLIESADAIADRVERLSQQIATPVLKRLSLEASGAKLIDTYPRRLPDLYPGQELRVLARVDGAGPVQLSLRAQGQKPVTLGAAVDPAREPRRPWIGKLWARERIGDLLEDIALRGNSQDKISETVELALAYNVVTPYTAFLAIPATELTPDAAAKLSTARQRKQAILALNPDAAALAPAGAAQGEGALAMPSPMAAPPEGVERTTGADGEDEVRVHGGGCAGCRIGERAPASGVLAWASAFVALIVARRRRRARGLAGRDR